MRDLRAFFCPAGPYFAIFEVFREIAPRQGGHTATVVQANTWGKVPSPLAAKSGPRLGKTAPHIVPRHTWVSGGHTSGVFPRQLFHVNLGQSSSRSKSKMKSLFLKQGFGPRGVVRFPGKPQKWQNRVPRDRKMPVNRANMVRNG